MSDMMTFPATVEEFMEQYKIVDDEKVYTNGADLVPIFRMMQWFEYVSATDTISRQAAIDAIENAFDRETILNRFVRKIAISAVRLLPSAQPEIIRCKDCKEYDPIYTGGAGVCGHWNAKTKNNAYCSYADRRKG